MRPLASVEGPALRRMRGTVTAIKHEVPWNCVKAVPWYTVVDEFGEAHRLGPGQMHGMGPAPKVGTEGLLEDNTTHGYMLVFTPDKEVSAVGATGATLAGAPR